MAHSPNNFSEQARQCFTLPQFKTLIKTFKELVQFSGVLYGWGYGHKPQLLYWKHCQEFPRSIFNAYVHQGFTKSDPLMKECFQRKKCQISSDVFKRLNSIRMKSDYRQFLQNNPLRFSLSGSYRDADISIFFMCTMKSTQSCRQAFPYFSAYLPEVLLALKRTFPTPRLSSEEIQILNLLSFGWTKHRINKQIGLSVPKITSHLNNIKKAFYASNMESVIRKAVAIKIL